MLESLVRLEALLSETEALAAPALPGGLRAAALHWSNSRRHMPGGLPPWHYIQVRRGL